MIIDPPSPDVFDHSRLVINSILQASREMGLSQKQIDELAKRSLEIVLECAKVL